MDLRSRISKKTSNSNIINPIELFESLTIRSTEVQELWRPQADALRDWHNIRKKNDILFMLNTGAGKTLIGLLAAQSLVNETQGKVLYLCATNQLVEQTKVKADEYGIPACTYYRQNWSGDEFERGIGPCITNYQAALNGKSIFNDEEVNAVIFDDAHTAYSTVQDQYTLRIEKQKFSDSWDEIMDMFKEYYKTVHRSEIFNDILTGVDNTSVLFVPTFISYKLAANIRSILMKDGIQDNLETLFVWEHLKNNLRFCAFYFDSLGIYITPPVPPIHKQKIFSKDVRRLYLSATISEGLIFSKTFGCKPEIIAPGGRAGDCERMILQSPQSFADIQAIKWFKEQAADEKVLIMIPSKKYVHLWEDFGDVFEANEGNRRLIKFSKSKDDKLILKARYDGIDLPGEACRILAINGLPSGISPIEKFFEQHLGAKGITNPLIATRLVQIFGRITRGMSDYGVFILIGRKLNKWINDPRHRKLLPTHIQKQLELGDLIMEDLEEGADLKQIIDMCLERKPGWVEPYEEFMANKTGVSKANNDKESYNKIGIVEHKFIKNLWKEEYEEALKDISEIIKLVDHDDESLKAWYNHWLAFTYLLYGAEKDANKCYLDAWKLKVEIGRPLINEIIQYDNNIKISEQAKIIATRLVEKGRKSLKQLEIISEDLMSSTPSQVEENLKILGYWLGFDATRPDNEHDIGPDVLWLTDDEKTAFIIEAKSDKQNMSLRKEEMGQFYQHISWVQKNYSNIDTEYRIIAGPCLDCSDSASPPDDLWAVSLEQFTNVSKKLLEILKKPLDERVQLLYAKQIQSGLELHSLTWDKLFNQIEKVCISDI
jgi:hypothetical protein